MDSEDSDCSGCRRSCTTVVSPEIRCLELTNRISYLEARFNLLRVQYNALVDEKSELDRRVIYLVQIVLENNRSLTIISNKLQKLQSENSNN